MEPEKHRGLLGRIAGLGWFSIGETVATTALVIMLEDPVLRDALLRRTEEITAADLRGVTWFHAEHIQDDLGRPDLIGVDRNGRPVLVVEAKFWAYLDTEQVRSYLDNQERLIGRDRGSALLLLVPTTRTATAKQTLDAVHRERASEGAGPYPTSTGVITWDDWLNVWDHAVDHLPATPDSVKGDLYQLRELCRTLGGFVIAPLAGAAFGSEWRKRETHLSKIFEQLTHRLKEPTSQVPPIQHEIGYDPMRYFSGGYGKSEYTVGIASRFADLGGPPFWLRYSKYTPDFNAVRVRIMSSDYADLVRNDDGHLWLRLDVPGDLAGPEVVERLLDRIEAIRRVASVDWP